MRLKDSSWLALCGRADLQQVFSKMVHRRRVCALLKALLKPFHKEAIPSLTKRVPVQNSKRVKAS